MAAEPTPIRPDLAPPTLPHSDEAERSVVGGILLYRDAFHAVSDLVAPRDFYDPCLGAIFEAMVAVDAASKRIDAITVGEQMRAADTFGRLRARGGEVLFAELMSAVVTVDNIAHYAEIIRGKARVRALIETCQGIAARAIGGFGDPAEILEDAERTLLEITAAHAPSRNEDFGPIAESVYREVAARSESGVEITGIRTGIAKLDGLLGGLRPGRLHIVAGLPGNGKTATAMQWADFAARWGGADVLVFSLEMPREELVERALSGDARVEGAALRSGRLAQADWTRLFEATSAAQRLPLKLNTSARTFPQIRSAARRWRMESLSRAPKRPGLVVIDYLGLIDPQRQRGELDSAAVGRVAWGCKMQLAMELGIPVVLLCQLNRESEKEKRRPRNSDLRDSGAIEQHADAIFFLHFDGDEGDKKKPVWPIMGILSKQRGGPTDDVPLFFDRRITRMSEAQPNQGELVPPRWSYDGPAREEHES